MTTLFRVEFWTEDYRNPTLMTRDEALAWLRSTGMSGILAPSGETADEILAKAVRKRPAISESRH